MVMPQEELHRLVQRRRFTQSVHGLRVFLDRHMQCIMGREYPSRRHEAFQFRRSHRLDCFRVV